MKFSMSALAVSVIVAASPAVAGSQVVASPGVTLTEAAQAKFNRDCDPDDRHVKPVAGNAEPSPQLYAAAGLDPAEAQGLTIDQVFIVKINREYGRDQEQLEERSATISSRSYSSDYERLARSAGLTPEEAAGMTLVEIAEVKMAPDH